MIKRILIALTAVILMTISASFGTVNARPTCGPSAYGHTTAGGAPTWTCTADDLPIFSGTDHVQSKGTPCPIDGLPVFYGHTLAGG